MLRHQRVTSQRHMTNEAMDTRVAWIASDADTLENQSALDLSAILALCLHWRYPARQKATPSGIKMSSCGEAKPMNLVTYGATSLLPQTSTSTSISTPTLWQGQISLTTVGCLTQGMLVNNARNHRARKINRFAIPSSYC